MIPRKYFVSYDHHTLFERGRVGGTDILTNNAVVKFIEDTGPYDGIINGGDHYDLNVVSDHNKGKLKLVEGQRLYDDYRAGNAVLHQYWDAAGRPKYFKLLEGNHEYRVKRYIDARPELDGFVNIEKHLPHFVQYVPYWSEHAILALGKANFIHGVATGSRQCASALRDYGKNTFMGHSHRRELLSLRYHGDDATKIAESLPCMCAYGQPYLNKRPTAWQQGFAIFYVWPNGVFNHYVVSIFNHSFYGPNGKFYNGNKVRPETRIEL